MHRELRLCTSVKVHNRIEKFQRVVLRPLEGVASNDRAKTATVTNRPDLAKHLVIPCGWATGEDEDTPAIETRLNHMPANRPWFSIRARFVRVPGLSLPYQLRMSRTRDMVLSSFVHVRANARMCPGAAHG